MAEVDVAAHVLGSVVLPSAPTCGRGDAKAVEVVVVAERLPWSCPVVRVAGDARMDEDAEVWDGVMPLVLGWRGDGVVEGV